jgi:peptidoglycan/LPS O-acetylase OafA/YrhL
LAVEEHFYFFLPVLVYFLPVRKLPWILLVIMSLCIGIKVTSTYAWGSWYTNPLETWMRIPYLLMGVLLNFEQQRTLYSLFFLVWIVVLAFFGFPIVGIEILIAIGLLLLVIGAISGRFVLKNRFLAFSGKICFGLYVIHYFVRIPFDNLGWDYSELSFLLKSMVLMVYMAISYLLAVASFNWFEMPIQRFRTRFEESKN